MSTVKIEGTMGLDSLDFYPKSEVLCRLGRKSRGVKSITTYRWSWTLNLSLAIRSLQFFIFVGRAKKKKKNGEVYSLRNNLTTLTISSNFIRYNFCAYWTSLSKFEQDLIRFNIGLDIRSCMIDRFFHRIWLLVVIHFEIFWAFFFLDNILE